MALGSTQPLVKISTRNIPWGKGGRCVRLATSPLSCAKISWKSGSLNFLEPSGPHRACYGTALPPFSLFSTIQSDKDEQKNEDDPIRREFIICIFHKTLLGDKINRRAWHSSRTMEMTNTCYILTEKRREENFHLRCRKKDILSSAWRKQQHSKRRLAYLYQSTRRYKSQNSNRDGLKPQTQRMRIWIGFVWQRISGCNWWTQHHSFGLQKMGHFFGTWTSIRFYL